MPMPGLKGAIDPSRLRVPSGNTTYPHGSSISRRRSSSIACRPALRRHSGSALRHHAANAATAGDSKNMSPAASGSVTRRSRAGSDDARIIASKWLQWFDTSTNGACRGRCSRPSTRRRCATDRYNLTAAHQIACTHPSTRPLSRRTLRHRATGGRSRSWAGSYFQSSNVAPVRALPRDDRGASAADDPRGLIESDPVKVPDVMKHGRRDQEQAVEAVEQPAVAGDQVAHVLDAEV